MSAFRPQSKLAQWMALYAYVTDLPEDGTFTLAEVSAIVNDACGVLLDEDRCRELISEMNRHVYTDGVRVMSVGRGGIYAKASPAEKLHHATHTVPRSVKRKIEDANRANVAVLKDARSTPDERRRANESLAHYERLAVANRENLQQQKLLRPELPSYRRNPETGAPE